MRHALRSAREAKGLTQTEVAEHFDWSLSKVQRIELGEVGVSVSDLRSLLDLLDVTEPATVKRLLDHARVSRRQRWMVESEVREHLTPAHAGLLQFEEAAASVRWFQTYVLPGSLQTPAYAEAVLRFYDPALHDDRRSVHLNVREQRRRAALDVPDAPELGVVVCEQVLMMNVGGVDVMAAQLRDLVESAARPNVSLRVLPMRDGGLLAGLGSFGLVSLDRGSSEGELLYREFTETDRLDDDSALLEFYRKAFADAWDRSLPEERSIRRIIAEAAALEAQSDRP